MRTTATTKDIVPEHDEEDVDAMATQETHDTKPAKEEHGKTSVVVTNRFAILAPMFTGALSLRFLETETETERSGKEKETVAAVAALAHRISARGRLSRCVRPRRPKTSSLNTTKKTWMPWRHRKRTTRNPRRKNTERLLLSSQTDSRSSRRCSRGRFRCGFWKRKRKRNVPEKKKKPSPRSRLWRLCHRTTLALRRKGRGPRHCLPIQD